MSAAMRDALRRLASRATVAVVSGRAREKIREFVDLGDLYYAGSHGFDIDGPGGLRHAVAQHTLPLLAEARKALEGKLGAVEGCAREDNRFSLCVHRRKGAPPVKLRTGPSLHAQPIRFSRSYCPHWVPTVCSACLSHASCSPLTFLRMNQRCTHHS